MDSKQTILYKCIKCIKCNKYYIQKEVADLCCSKDIISPKICNQCNKNEIDSYRTICDDCKELNRFKKAEKIEDFDGYVVTSTDDDYYPDINELKEYYEEQGYDLPKYVYVTKEIKWELTNHDIDNMIENSLENHYEDASDHIVDLKELEDFIEIWNKKQTIVSYEPDYTNVILL